MTGSCSRSCAPSAARSPSASKSSRYVELQRIDDTLEGHALRRYWKGHYFRSLPDDAIEAFLLRGTSDGSGEHLPDASLQAYGGAIAEVPDADSAFSQRDAMFEFVASARWSDATEDEQRMSAARRYGASLEPFASGMYVNAMSDEGAAGVARAYPPAKLARLGTLKAAYDPDNVFHLNQNRMSSQRRSRTKIASRYRSISRLVAARGVW